MKILMMMATVASLIGCGMQAPGSANGGDGSGLTQVFLVGMFVNPSPNHVCVGQTTTFVAYGTWSDGTQGEVNVTWESSNTSLATIDVDGVASGLVIGTCDIIATSTFTAGVTATGTLHVDPAPPPAPTINTPSMPNGTVGQAYTKTITYVDGSGVPTWSITVGSLPPGLQLNGSTGIVAGTPTTTGTYNFTVQVSAGGIGTKALSIQINPASNNGGPGVIIAPGPILQNPIQQPGPIQQIP